MLSFKSINLFIIKYLFLLFIRFTFINISKTVEHNHANRQDKNKDNCSQKTNTVVISQPRNDGVPKQQNSAENMVTKYSASGMVKYN